MSPYPPLVVVQGTWGMLSGLEGGWWGARGPFIGVLKAAGLELLDERTPYFWSTELGGSGSRGGLMAWESAGASLRDYIAARTSGPVSVLGHSHGGNVIACAAKRGARFDTAVTVAMPIRQDMKLAYRFLRANSTTWGHLFSDESSGIGWQKLGEWNPMSLESWKRLIWPTREINLAYPLIYCPDQSHSSMMDPSLWRHHGWAEIFKGRHEGYEGQR